MAAASVWLAKVPWRRGKGKDWLTPDQTSLGGGKLRIMEHARSNSSCITVIREALGPYSEMLYSVILTFNEKITRVFAEIITTSLKPYEYTQNS